jgi:hypothetical protein
MRFNACPPRKWIPMPLARRLLSSAQFNREVVDYASVTGRLSGDAQRVKQIPIAEDESAQQDVTLIHRYCNVCIVEVRVGAKRGFHASSQFFVRHRVSGLRGRAPNCRDRGLCRCGCILRAASGSETTEPKNGRSKASTNDPILLFV